MEQQAVQLDRETFSCSICLDLLKDPVTIPCGHSYCMDCIKAHWDEEDQKRVHSCPQCRKTFIPRPVLQKNTMLAALVEQLKKTGLQVAPADHCYAGPEDVACDVCSGRKLKAIKSCLACPASYCEKHLQPHYEVAPLKKHKLVEPTKNLQENICSQHDEVMKMYCRKDRKCICYLCPVDYHKGHDTVSAAAERTERQKELDERRGKIQQMIKDKDKDVKLLQQETEDINVSADKTVKESEKIFTELIRLLRKRSSEVKQQIRSKQETEVSRVKDVQEKLEQEIRELKRKDAELEQLSNIEDHIQFLLNYPSLPALRETEHTSIINIRPLRHFEDVTAAVSELSEKLQDILKDPWTNIELSFTEVDVLLSEPGPKSRAGFLKYSCEIILDSNKADTQLTRTNQRQSNSGYYINQSYSSGSGSFTGCYQFLSRESLPERCYWEVKWEGQQVYVAVAYKNTRREENEYDRSWALVCSSSYENNYFKFVHDKFQTYISGPHSSRVGVYLDHRAGILSFYRVSETMTLLHRVQTKFTEPLHAGVWVSKAEDFAVFYKPQ
ncbi:PREDICTED: tripartite motif-containing protein 16-like [Poecilia mexicana]|uniref:tripartite motif-containing protein 16-like n=1 Tax=Poecilia mexicana TaxID=48701 RepID=UPI00072DBEE9|nr:PREDICTED: tripartite motif-containing protein 16-like [Poecilia mexicana]